MPAKEIKELRKTGKLDEAYEMARTELQAEPDNIWSKRNMSWVLYDQLDAAAADLTAFLDKWREVKELALPLEEVMFYENIALVIAKAARKINSEDQIDYNKLYRLFDAIKDVPIKRGTKWYAVLYSAFHKGMKESFRYLEFADWWGFENFRPEDYEKERMPNRREIMALAEQAYIAYAKHLLPRTDQNGNVHFEKEKAEAFLPKITAVAEQYPRLQYPAFFQAKLLLALGDRENTLSALLPFAKKKQNDFWVWDVLAEAFKDDSEKVLACYCKALTCMAAEEMLVNLRQRMAAIFIERSMFNEAKTEIEKLVNARSVKGWKIPANVANWQEQSWYINATIKKSNEDFYNQHKAEAEAILYSDISEELVIVEFVNTEKKILNFVASESKYGFFKYGRFLEHAKVGEVLKVRIESGTNGELFRVFTAVPVNDNQFKAKFIREVEGTVRIKPGQSFGFLSDVFIHPSLIVRYRLKDGANFKGKAIKSFNRERRNWGWKLL